MVTCSQTCILWRVSSHVTCSPVWWCSDSVVRVLISLIHHQLLSNEDNKYLTITTLLTSSNFTYHNSLPMFWSHSEYTNVIVFCLQNCLSRYYWRLPSNHGCVAGRVPVLTVSSECGSQAPEHRSRSTQWSLILTTWAEWVDQCHQWSYIGWQNLNPLSHPNATLVPQAKGKWWKF